MNQAIEFTVLLLFLKENPLMRGYTFPMETQNSAHDFLQFLNRKKSKRQNKYNFFFKKMNITEHSNVTRTKVTNEHNKVMKQER